jgi:hypothetical protein
MRRLIAIAAMAVTSSGIGVVLTASGAHAGAAECIQLTNPTANFVVQTACRTIDPGGN